jgi:hypothetical protein
MPLPGGGKTRIKRCQSIWPNHTPRSMSIRWDTVHFGGMGFPNIYTNFILYETKSIFSVVRADDSVFAHETLTYDGKDELN